MAGKQDRQPRKPRRNAARNTNSSRKRNPQQTQHRKPANTLPSYVFAAPDDLRMKLSVTNSQLIFRLISDLYHHGGGNLTYENGYVSFQAAVAPYGGLRNALEKLQGPS
ncbi:ORF9 protein [Simian hemorrhagic encephalitis virus]|uniref:ORF9 protein n=1 Tax=Simian hemorrhagic encephalitis virus TaxID=1965068 RepID=A0A0F6PTV5_9NIDO|nr:ORF9 protein [Simian hemorrhagic encephalitis virus]AKC89303.1 ORF9 protein [Simian hemorrhagic encephalitis virus]